MKDSVGGMIVLKYHTGLTLNYTLRQYAKVQGSMLKYANFL
jgi:hypothetical protein